MKIRGMIKTVRSITSDGIKCKGLYEGQGNNFIIRVDKKIMEKQPSLFLRVLLHEILHLYMFIIDDYTKEKLNLTEGVQHTLMGKLVKELTDKIAERAIRVAQRSK